MFGIDNILRYGAPAFEVLRHYPTSLYNGYKHRRLFSAVKTYFMFIGYSRSGHSLVGSLLDAHPDIVCGHELGVLKYVHAGYSRIQIYHLILENSRRFTEGGCSSSGYTYSVPNQWQGRYQNLKVIGDKQAAGAVLRLGCRPQLLERLRRTIGGSVKFIHVIRNPYDNISTMARKENMSLRHAIAYYFGLCDTVIELKAQIDSADLFEFKHESLISETKSVLKNICEFLQVDSPEDYLTDCASIVFASPHKTRRQYRWHQSEIEIVQGKISQIPYLMDYAYEV